MEEGRVTRVAPEHGAIRAGVVVNAAGSWSREVGALAGVAIPAAAVEHQYMVTEKLADLPPGLPTLRDPDNNFYLKPEVGGFAIGGWEDDAPSFGQEGGIPPDFARELLASNFERFEQIALPAAARVPVLNEVGVIDISKRHSRVLLGPGAVVTPLARDKSRQVNLELVTERS